MAASSSKAGVHRPTGASYRSGCLSMLTLSAVVLVLSMLIIDSAAGHRLTSDERAKVKRSVDGSQSELIEGQTVFRRLLKRSADAASSGGETPRTCHVEVQEIRRIPGRCIRLMGGMPACNTDEFLDPLNTECQ